MGTRRGQGDGHHCLDRGARRPRPQPRWPSSSIRAPRSGRDRTSWQPRTAGTHRGTRPSGVSSTSPARGSGRRRSSGTASAVPVTPFFELAVTRGLYWKSGTNDPARAARAGGVVPGHLCRPPGRPHVGDHDLLAVTAYPHRSPRSGAARAVTLATRLAPIRRFRRVEALGMPSTLRDHEVSSQSLLAVPARRYGKAPAPCICGRRIGAGCEAASGQSCSAQICRLRFAARSARSERCQPGCRARPTAHRHLLTRLQSASEKGRNVRGSEGVISGGQHLLVEVPGGAPVA